MLPFDGLRTNGLVLPCHAAVFFTRFTCAAAEPLLNRPAAISAFVSANATSSSHSRRWWYCAISITTKHSFPRTEIIASGRSASTPSMAAIPFVFSSLAVRLDMAYLLVEALCSASNSTLNSAVQQLFELPHQKSE